MNAVGLILLCLCVLGIGRCSFGPGMPEVVQQQAESPTVQVVDASPRSTGEAAPGSA